MTSKEKKAMLRDYQKHNREINLLLREKEQLYALATAVTSAYAPRESQLTDGGNTRENTLIKVIHLEEEIDAKVDQLIEKKNHIAKVIEEITNDTMRDLMRYRYILGYTWERVAVEMNYSYVHVCRLHGEALKML